MILAMGFVSATQGAIYKADRPVLVESVNYFNTSAATQTVTTYLRSETLGAGEYARHVMSQNWRAKPISDVTGTESLGSGDSVEASTTTADAVRFQVLGRYL